MKKSNRKESEMTGKEILNLIQELEEEHMPAEKIIEVVKDVLTADAVGIGS